MSQPVAECGYPVNLTGSAAISTGACQLLGFYVNSTSSGTMNIKDGGSSGTALCGTITPAIGFHRFPADVGTSAYFTKVSGTIDVTFFIASAN
jgi:hypothetical protein